MFSHNEQTLEIPGLDAEALHKYEVTPHYQRPLIQDAFPQLSPAAREFIKTGTTAAEWVDTFGGSLCGDCNGIGMECGPQVPADFAAICSSCNGHGYFRRVTVEESDNTEGGAAMTRFNGDGNVALPVPQPIRCGDLVHYARDWCDRIRATPEIRRMVGTVVWVDRTSPNYTLVHIAWANGNGASRVNIKNVERVS
jgi:hypothetical protein